jgi:8-oxo-dGTP pyrophosphatase MutT (NUDIX family)
MIRFDQDQHRFNFRVVGIALHENRVLLHQAPGEEFWTFPGGRAELGETTQATLRREMREELHTEIEVIRLLWVVENFFDYDDRHYHELAFYFLMRFAAESAYVTQRGPFYSQDAGVDLVFQWFANAPDVLTNLPLLPSFLPTELQHLPATTEHRIHYGK